MTEPIRPDWLDPLEHKPPRGRKLHVLTWGGCATEGHWNPRLYCGWNYLADTSDVLKHRMMLWATGRKDELEDAFNA